MRPLGKKPHFWPSQRLKKVLLTTQGCARLRTGPIIMQKPRGYQKKKFIVWKGAICATLRKKPHFWPSQRLKRVLLTTQGCARLRTGPIIMQIPRGYHKKKFIVWKGAICATLREKNPFLAFPEAKKGVVNYASLRKAAHWPNNNANPSGLSEKKVYCVESLQFCR